MSWIVPALSAALIASGRDLLLKRYARATDHPVAASLRTILGVAAGCLAGVAWLACTGELGGLCRSLAPVAWLFPLGAALEVAGQCCYFAALARLPLGTLVNVYATTPLWILAINRIAYDDGGLTRLGIAGTCSWSARWWWPCPAATGRPARPPACPPSWRPPSCSPAPTSC